MLQGTYTALITPFSQDGREIDFDRLRRNIEFQSIAGVQGVLPCGTTGEAPTLAIDEWRQMIEQTVHFARPLGLQVIAGAGSNCTSHAVELHRYAASVGADASLQVVPYYNKPSQSGLFAHFMQLADACELPIVLYNIPGRCGCGLDIDTIARLADHPNIIAVKEASGSTEMAGLIASRTGLAVLSGDDPLTLDMMRIGARGVISVVSNIMPHKVAALVAAADQNNWSHAHTIHREIEDLSLQLLQLDTNPGPIKAAMAMLNRDSGVLRLPLTTLAEPAQRLLRETLTRCGLLEHQAVGAVA